MAQRPAQSARTTTYLTTGILLILVAIVLLFTPAAIFAWAAGTIGLVVIGFAFARRGPTTNPARRQDDWG